MTNDDRIATLIRQRDDLHHQLADLMTRCANLRADRDAWRETAQRAMAGSACYETILATDATDPPKAAPKLAPHSIPNPAPFPAQALRGGNGVFMG